VRIILENDTRFSLAQILSDSYGEFFSQLRSRRALEYETNSGGYSMIDRHALTTPANCAEDPFFWVNSVLLYERDENKRISIANETEFNQEVHFRFHDLFKIGDGLKAFILDRLKGDLRDKGMRHDIIDAILSLGADDLVDIVNRTSALQSFIDTADGENLLAGG